MEISNVHGDVCGLLAVRDGQASSQNHSNTLKQRHYYGKMGHGEKGTCWKSLK